MRLAGEGAEGWGESVAGEHPNYGPETVDTVWLAIRQWLAPRLLGRRFGAPDEVWPALDRNVRGHHMAKAALEMAAWELAARAAGVSLAACLGGVAAIYFGQLRQGLLLLFLVAFIGFFAFSQGAVIWVYLSEVFPNRVRGKGQSLGSFSHWFMNAIISGVFPLMAARSGGYAFLFFCAMTVVQFIVVLMFYPETKGVSLEEMQKKLELANLRRD